jgi:hypothetical protein
MNAITRDTIDALLDAGALQINMLTEDWFSIKRYGKTDSDGDQFFLAYRVVGKPWFGTITEFEFQSNGGVLPSDYYRVRQDG